MTVEISTPPVVVISPTGTQGPRGNSVLSGAGVPAPTIGVDGDWYINNANPALLVIYGPKAAGAWGTGQPIGGTGGGGATPVRTATMRVTDDNLSGLPSAPTWAVVATSAGTPLQCSIPAVAGDRIKVFGNFMRSGSHFHDWVMLDTAGAIAQYAASGTGSPLSEGNPSLYPSFSFSYATAGDMFTAGSGNLSAGLVTVGLAHQGTGAGIVYAHPVYPFKLRLENIGPEPA